MFSKSNEGEKEKEQDQERKEKKKRKHRDKEVDVEGEYQKEKDKDKDFTTEEESQKKKRKKEKKKEKETDEAKEPEKEKDKSDITKNPNSSAAPFGQYQLNEPDKRSESFFEDDDDKFGELFSDSAVRAKFIRKVYLILSIQLGFTTCFNIPFLYLDDVQEFVYDYHWILFIALAVFVVPYFMLVCCESTRRSFPTNIILLFLMTLGMAGVCGYMTAKMDTEVVFYAFLLTVVVTLSITTLAIFCPFDFTSCFMVLCVVIIVLIVFAMIALIIVLVIGSFAVSLIYSGICVILFSLFLMFDTQAIIGGRRVSLNPEEYILAAIQIYVDIVEIFLNFLELIGACTEND